MKYKTAIKINEKFELTKSEKMLVVLYGSNVFYNLRYCLF